MGQTNFLNERSDVKLKHIPFIKLGEEGKGTIEVDDNQQPKIIFNYVEKSTTPTKKPIAEIDINQDELYFEWNVDRNERAVNRIRN